MTQPQLPLSLPVVQNWSCHSCGGCCRQHLIEITTEEKQRIESQGWEKDPAFLETPLFRWHAGPFWAKRYRLNHQADGACIFLDEKGLCRIHAKFGEPTKPLACRLYPYVFHPAGRRVSLSLRFSCPSVAANLGTPVEQSTRDIKSLQREVVPVGAARMEPPQVNSRSRIPWDDLDRIVQRLAEEMQNPGSPLVIRLVRTLFWVDLLGRADFRLIQGGRVDELLDVLITGAAEETKPIKELAIKPEGLTGFQFRMLVGLYSRRESMADLSLGVRRRLKLLKTAIRLARGVGIVPLEAAREVSFEEIEHPFGPRPRDIDEMLERYFQVKLLGYHFLGRAFYNYNLVEGFQSLALTYPAVLWLARFKSRSDSRSTLTFADAQWALNLVDHHHGYSPLLGSSSSRSRTRTLAKQGGISRLCAWYSQ